MANFFANYPVTGAAAGNNASVGPTGTTAPTSATEIGIIDGSGNLQGVSSSNPIPVTGTVTPTANSNGSFIGSTTIGSVTATTFTPPANAVGFILEASSANTVNLRWAIVTTPTTTSGMRAEPGRDSGYVPCAANLLVIAESGSNQEAEITWVQSS